MKTSVKTTARFGGILYLVIIIAGIFSEMFVRNRLIEPGNTAATAANIMNAQLLWRAGIVCDLLMHVCDLPLAVILYFLLKPVHKNLALLAMLFTLIQTAVMVAFKLNLCMPLFLLSDTTYTQALDPHQLQALSYAFIRFDAYGFNFGLLFFGFACIINGHLIKNAGYLPRLIGPILQIGGACYIINSLAVILVPQFAANLFPLILLPSFIAEVSFCIWLLTKGVKVRIWEEKIGLLQG